MMCAFAEFWWIFLAAGIVSGFILALGPSEEAKAGLISGAISVLCIVLLTIAGGAKYTPGCTEMKYQAMLDRRPELAQECPDREKPACQVKWIRYQQDSLSRYLQVLQ